MSNTFVIQEHTGYGPAHYDLMLDTSGDALATWRLSRRPGEMAEGETTPARRLGDHRRAYLTYEGPVSQRRGKVRIVDRGEYRTLFRDDEAWEIVLSGKDARGRFGLRKVSREKPDEWTIARLPNGPGRACSGGPVSHPPQAGGEG